jgi:glycine/D-amino acid oxidase-like deaminating enzyme
VQLDRARAEIEEHRSWGFGPDDHAMLGADEARERLDATDVLGATYSPHCAAIHPARLVRGLARAVERRGVTIHERTRVTRIEPGVVRTEHGDVRAPKIIRATEAWTSQLPGSERDVAPVYSLMLATEPLPAAFWDQVGLRHGETFSDHRHLIVYGQRTADDRIAFGGRGAPYHLRSRIRPEFDREPEVFDGLWRVLRDLFPSIDGHAVTHTWGARSGSRATGTRRSGWIPRPAWAGAGATSATVSPRATSPGARSPTSCAARRATARGCRGSTAARRGGSRSRCGGWASTWACA